MEYSSYQKNIFNEVLTTNNNIAVNATAGSGKTSTIVHASKLLVDKKLPQNNLFLAFNKSIVEELQQKLPEDITCKTIHSMGMQCLMKFYKCNLKVDKLKVFKLSESVLKEEKIDLPYKELMILKFTIADIINLMRLTLCKNNYEDVLKMTIFYDIDASEIEINLSLKVFDVLEKYNSKINFKSNFIDFTDMVYLPATNNKMILPKFDTIFIDEIQDLNNAQHLFIEKIKKSNGRTIGVGDKRQAIYSFAGADIESFEKFEKKENTISMPLTISYRCPKNVVLNAQKIFPEIETFEVAKEGVVRHGIVEEIEPNDLVICRNCKPLVVIFLKLLKLNKKSFIKGSDIEQGILKLVVKQIEFDKVNGLILLRDQLNRLENELRESGVGLPKVHYKYRALKEKIEIIELIAQDCNHMSEVEKKVKFLFEDKSNAIQLMTIHKSKGLENERVFFIEKFNNNKLIPSKYASQQWEFTQENNLLFVALTRSKNELIYLNLIE